MVELEFDLARVTLQLKWNRVMILLPTFSLGKSDLGHYDAGNAKEMEFGEKVGCERGCIPSPLHTPCITLSSLFQEPLFSIG